MRVKIVGGKIYLPKDIRMRVGLRDEYEVTIVGDEIILRPRLPDKLNLNEIIKKPATEVSIDEMVEAEDVDAD